MVSAPIDTSRQKVPLSGSLSSTCDVEQWALGQQLIYKIYEQLWTQTRRRVEEQVLFFSFDRMKGGLVQTWSNQPTWGEFSIVCDIFSKRTHSHNVIWEVNWQSSGGIRRTQVKCLMEEIIHKERYFHHGCVCIKCSPSWGIRKYWKPSEILPHT